MLILSRYFIITNLAKGEDEVIRFAALLRGTESAWQAVSYGLTSLPLFGEVGGVYFNFLLWALAIGPAWLVIRQFGTDTQQHDGHDGELGGVVSGEDVEGAEAKSSSN